MPDAAQLGSLPELGRVRVPAEWLDLNGHVNVQHYLSMYNLTSDTLLELLGISGDWVRREQLGLKRARVGSLAGLQASHYERVEDDAVTPGLEAVAKIARALDCAAGWIAFGEGEAPAPPEAAA